jgi:hypothetical protein
MPDSPNTPETAAKLAKGRHRPDTALEVQKNSPHDRSEEHYNVISAS